MPKSELSKLEALELDALISELTKDEPNLDFVKQQMELFGLNFTEDPVERLNSVLMCLHPSSDDEGLTEAQKDIDL